MTASNISSTHRSSSSFWLSPTETQAAQLADRMGILTAAEATTPFPFYENDDEDGTATDFMATSKGADFFGTNEASNQHTQMQHLPKNDDDTNNNKIWLQ